MTRSKFEESFERKYSLPYEKFSLPYVKNYIPDFHDTTTNTILELKGVLERDDATKISSVYNFINTDTLYIIAGGKFQHLEELTRLTKVFNPTVFKYPDAHYVVCPQMTPAQLASFRLSKGKRFCHDHFPLKGADIVAWCNRVGITALPMSYQDHLAWEKYCASIL